jgi:hypothetical protein
MMIDLKVMGMRIECMFSMKIPQIVEYWCIQSRKYGTGTMIHYCCPSARMQFRRRMDEVALQTDSGLVV